MANVNKVFLVGRLTREPEIRSTQYGKIANIGFAVNGRKKDAGGQWVDEPIWLDLQAFDRENGRKNATTIESFTHKGSQIYVEGHLKLDQWEDRNGRGKCSKVVIVVDEVQLLDAKERAAPPAPETMTTPTRGGRDVGYDPDPF